MMSWETILLVATISFLGMISPGPDFFMVVKNSLAYPRKYALTTSLGIIMGIFTHMSYCVAGVAVIIATTPWLFTFLKYAGAFYLIYLGVKALCSKGLTATYIDGSSTSLVTYKKAFIEGYLCNLLNPKATLFFLALFTQVLAIDSSLFAKLIVAGINCIEGIIWWLLVVFVFQSQIVQRRYFKLQFIIDKLFGGILVVLGIKVALGT